MTLTQLQHLLEINRTARFDSSDEPEEVWRTIGAKDHHGGTPVLIKKATGEIEAGPKKFVHKNVDALPQTNTAKDVGDFFKTAKNAATDGYVDSMWRRVQSNQPIARMGALENKLRDAQKSGSLKSRDDIAKIVAAHFSKTPAPPIKPTQAASQPKPIRSMDALRQRLERGVVGQKPGMVGLQKKPGQPVPVDKELAAFAPLGNVTLPTHEGVLDKHLEDAYRRAAAKQGFEIGAFKVDPETNLASADVSKAGRGLPQPAPKAPVAPQSTVHAQSATATSAEKHPLYDRSTGATIPTEAEAKPKEPEQAAAQPAGQAVPTGAIPGGAAPAGPEQTTPVPQQAQTPPATGTMPEFPHQVTASDYLNAYKQHREANGLPVIASQAIADHEKAVGEALKAGHQVPSEVLKDYAHLQPPHEHQKAALEQQQANAPAEPPTTASAQGGPAPAAQPTAKPPTGAEIHAKVQEIKARSPGISTEKAVVQARKELGYVPPPPKPKLPKGASPAMIAARQQGANAAQPVGQPRAAASPVAGGAPAGAAVAQAGGNQMPASPMAQSAPSQAPAVSQQGGNTGAGANPQSQSEVEREYGLMQDAYRRGDMTAFRQHQERAYELDKAARAGEQAEAATAKKAGRQPKAPKPERGRIPPSKAAIQEQLLDAYLPTVGDEQTVSAQEFDQHQNPTTFLNKLPGEISQFLEGRAHLRKMFRVTNDPAQAGGEDAMQAMGERYFNTLEGAGQSQVNKALEFARKSQDPGLNFLAAVHDTIPTAAAGKRPKPGQSKIAAENAASLQREKNTEMVPPEKLTMDTAGTVHGIPVHVTEDEEGTAILKDAGELPETPVAALHGAVPFDKGSLHKQEPQVGENPFGEVMNEPQAEAPQAPAKTEQKPTGTVEQPPQKPPTPSEVASGGEEPEPDTETLKNHAQMYRDAIAADREHGRQPNQQYLNKLSEIESKLRGETPEGGIASNEVFGHPQATNIRSDKYGNLVPIKVSDTASVERRMQQAQNHLDELNTKWGRASAIAGGKMNASPKEKKQAQEYLRSAQADEDKTIIDGLRNETIPELNRLHRELSANQQKTPVPAGSAEAVAPPAVAEDKEPAQSEPSAETPAAPDVDTTRQLGLYARDAAGNPVEVGERPGQASLFNPNKYRAAEKPAEPAPVAPQFDPKHTMPLQFPAAQSAQGEQKEPWQKTLGEALGKRDDEIEHRENRDRNSPAGQAHEAAVEKAIDEGKPVPANVLKHYPWLEAKRNVKPYVESLRGMSDKELKAEAKRTANELNSWSKRGPLGGVEGHEHSERMNAVDREIESRRTGESAEPTKEPHQLTRGEFMAKGVKPLPEDHPLRQKMDNEVMPEIQRTLKELESYRKPSQHQHSVNDLLNSRNVPKDVKDRYRQARAKYDQVSDAVDAEVDHRKVVENALKEGKEVPAHVLAEYPDLKPAEAPQPMGLEQPAPTEHPVDTSEVPKATPPETKQQPAPLGDRLSRVRDLREMGMTFEQAKAHQAAEAQAGHELPPTPQHVTQQAHVNADAGVQATRQHYEEVKKKTPKGLPPSHPKHQAFTQAAEKASAAESRSRAEHEQAVKEAIAKGEIQNHPSYPNLGTPPEQPSQSFDPEAWEKKQQAIKDRVEDSKRQRKFEHLDQAPWGVEYLRGKQVTSLRDGSTGIIKTVDNTGTAHVEWLDEKSAENNSGYKENVKVSPRSKKERPAWMGTIQSSDKSEFVLAKPDAVKAAYPDVPVSAAPSPVESLKQKIAEKKAPVEALKQQMTAKQPQMVADPKALSITKKGNAVGFTKDGDTVTVGYQPGRKGWVVRTIADDGGVQTQKGSQTFATEAEARHHAASLLDFKKTKEKAWWNPRAQFRPNSPVAAIKQQMAVQRESDPAIGKKIRARVSELTKSGMSMSDAILQAHNDFGIGKTPAEKMSAQQLHDRIEYLSNKGSRTAADNRELAELRDQQAARMPKEQPIGQLPEMLQPKAPKAAPAPKAIQPNPVVEPPLEPQANNPAAAGDWTEVNPLTGKHTPEGLQRAQASVNAGVEAREQLEQQPPKSDNPAVQYVRAPAGGAYSPITNKHYAGGHWMPIHGDYAGQKKAPASGNAAPPTQGTGEGEGKSQPPRQPLSQEELDRRAAESAYKQHIRNVKNTPLGNMLAWNDSHPDEAGGPKGNFVHLGPWKDYAESVGEPALKELAEKFGKIADPEQLAYHKKYHEDDLSKSLRGSKTHLKEFPSSMAAHSALSAALEKDPNSLAHMHEMGKILAEAKAQAHPELTALTEQAKGAGYIPNRYAGTTAAGKRVKAGEGFVKKNSTGQWETHHADDVRKELGIAPPAVEKLKQQIAASKVLKGIPTLAGGQVHVPLDESRQKLIRDIQDLEANKGGDVHRYRSDLARLLGSEEKMQSYLNRRAGGSNLVQSLVPAMGWKTHDTEQGAAQAAKEQSAEPAPAHAEAEVGKKYKGDQSFRRNIDIALLPPRDTRKNAEHYIFDIPAKHGEQMMRTLGTDDYDKLYFYRSPNRPLDFLSAGEIESGKKHLVVPGDGSTDDTLITDKPLSPQRIASLQLSTVPHTNSQQSLGIDIANSLAGKGPIEMAYDTGTEHPRGVVISPSANEKGKWQATYFDKLGFSGHTVHANRDDAIKEAMNEGYMPGDHKLMDELSQGDDWKRGAKLQQVKQYADKLSDLPDRSDYQELMRVNAVDGPDAALKWIAEHKQKKSATPIEKLKQQMAAKARTPTEDSAEARKVARDLTHAAEKAEANSSIGNSEKNHLAASEAFKKAAKAHSEAAKKAKAAEEPHFAKEHESRAKLYKVHAEMHKKWASEAPEENEGARPFAQGQAEPAKSAPTQAVSQSQVVTPQEAAALDESKLIPTKQVHAELEKYYQNKPGSSRTNPVHELPFKPGDWRIDDHHGIYGRDIEKLMELDPNKLTLSEDDYTNPKNNAEGRGDDARRYAEWLKEGKTPPPIHVVETDQGTLRVTDGHRRLAAAKMAGKPIQAWVSPRMDTGKKDSNGNPIYTGLTYEGVKHGAPEANKMWEQRQKDMVAKIEAERDKAKPTEVEKPTTPVEAPTPPTPVEQLKQHMATAQSRQRAQRQKLVEDFGEKIGGARKDVAVPLGPRKQGEKGEVDERPAWQKRYGVHQDAKSGKWFVTRGDDPTGAGRILDRIYGRGIDYDTKEEAEKAVPLMEVARNHSIHREGKEDTYGIYRKVSDRKRPLVKGGFASEADAKRYMVEHPAEIIEHKFPFPDEVEHLKNVERTGKEHRTGNIKPADFHTAFGFRGGEFGNWNTGREGQEALNHAYDGLHDLADAIGVPPKAVSLDGKLAIAFGARGHGGKDSAAAHYETGKEVMNLTKLHGAGHLAHEWFHALDHYVGKLAGKNVRSDKPGDYFASHGVPSKHAARQEVVDAFKNVIDTMTAKHIDKPIEPKFETQRLAHSRGRLEDSIKDLDRRLGDEGRYNKRFKKFTPEQQSKWDDLKAKLMAGDTGEKVHVPGKDAFSSRTSYANIEAMNDLYKKATGRSFTAGGQESHGAKIFWQLHNLKEAEKRVNAAHENQTETKKVPTDYFNEARKIDSYRASDYYATPHEMAARAFAAFVHDKINGSGNKSQYLVHGTKNHALNSTLGKPFPEGEERQQIHAAFERLFKAIKTQERTDEKGRTHVQMFSADADSPRRMTIVELKRMLQRTRPTLANV